MMMKEVKDAEKNKKLGREGEQREEKTKVLSYKYERLSLKKKF